MPFPILRSSATRADGIALARRVKQRWPTLPIVLISGEFADTDWEQL